MFSVRTKTSGLKDVFEKPHFSDGLVLMVCLTEEMIKPVFKFLQRSVDDAKQVDQE